MKEAYYFSHDSNASQDPKILEMCSLYQAAGYGWYWMIVEMLRNQENYKLKISGKYAMNALARRMYTDQATLTQFIDDCIHEFELFESDGEFIWSKSLIKRMEKKQEKIDQAKEASKKRWNKQKKDNNTNEQCVSNDNNTNEQCVSNASAMRQQCVSNAIKGNESKGNESKGNESKQHHYPHEEQKLPKLPIAKSFRVFEENIGTINAHIAEQLGMWIDKINDDVVGEAVVKAAEQGKRTWAYISSILRNWEASGVNTLQDIRNLDDQFKAKRFNQQGKITEEQQKHEIELFLTGARGSSP